MRLAPGALTLTVVLGGAALARSGEWAAPPEEKARANPVAPRPDNVLKGRSLYQRHCAACHGEKGKGDGPAAQYSPQPVSDLTNPELQRLLTDGEMLWKITHGRREADEILMPGFGKKIRDGEDRWKVVLFVRALATAPEAEPR